MLQCEFNRSSISVNLFSLAMRNQGGSSSSSRSAKPSSAKPSVSFGTPQKGQSCSLNALSPTVVKQELQLPAVPAGGSCSSWVAASRLTTPRTLAREAEAEEAKLEPQAQLGPQGDTAASEEKRGRGRPRNLVSLADNLNKTYTDNRRFVVACVCLVCVYV